jgi:RNA polymerase sigma-70 factor (ECF subfamily)
MQDILSRALGSLDPQMRAVLVLRDMQDLEYSQISEVLNVPVGTVKSRLFRARVALRTAVEAEAARGSAEL